MFMNISPLVQKVLLHQHEYTIFLCQSLDKERGRMSSKISARTFSNEGQHHHHHALLLYTSKLH
jgi:hypothetical protein